MKFRRQVTESGPKKILDRLFHKLSENLNDRLGANQVTCEDVSVTWVEIFRIASNLSDDLKKLNLASGSIVVIEIDSSLEFLIALIAGIKSELIIAPISPDLPTSEFISALDLIKPIALLRTNKGKIDSTRYFNFHKDFEFSYFSLQDTFDFSILINQKYNETDCDDRVYSTGQFGAFIRFTSGTTGKSKGVMISFDRAFERIKITEENYGLTGDDFVLSLLPLPYHFIAALLSFVSAKSNLRIVSNMHSENFEDSFHQKCSLIYAAPFHFDYLNGLSVEGVFRRLRLALSTSVALSENTFETFKTKFGVSISQSYGIIEVGILAANIENNSPSFSFQSVGKPFKQYRISLLSEDDNILSKDEGVLTVSGPGLFDCYLEPFKYSSEINKNGAFVTGDRVEIVDEKLYIRGRSSAVINIAGFKVFPEEVEEVLSILFQIVESKVYAVPHDIFGNVLSVDIVVKSGESLSVSEVVKHCRQHLVRYKVPKIVNFVTSILKNDAGKILR